MKRPTKVERDAFTKKIRKVIFGKNGRSQESLAKAIGVNPSAVSRWISGKDYASEDHQRRLSEVTGVEFRRRHRSDAKPLVALRARPFKYDPEKHTILYRENRSGMSRISEIIGGPPMTVQLIGSKYVAVRLEDYVHIFMREDAHQARAPKLILP